MDIDIDLPTSFDPKNLFPNTIKASMIQNGKLVKHPCGTYFQNIAVAPNGLSAIPYDIAEELGYFKIDMLHNSALDQFTSKRQIRDLLNRPVNWTLLRNPDTVKRLIHIRDHFDLVIQVQPTSIEELADCLALIRPGKRQLLQYYLDDRDEIRDKYLYTQSGSYSFKRSHAIAYAHMIVVQLNLIEYGIPNET